MGVHLHEKIILKVIVLMLFMLSRAYQYNKNDELLRTDTLNTDTEKDSVVIYKNDKNGNQLATVNRYEIPSDKKDNTYVDIDVTLGDNRLNENVVNHYNALNQLTKTLTKNYKVSFTYDAEGLRTNKTVNGEKTVFVWDGDQLVMELGEGGKVQKRYVRGNDLIYADKGENTEKQYYVTDPHGNVVQLTDDNGVVTKTYEYDSFGNEVKPDEKDEPLSLHLYAYCENDGVNMVDPSGHWGIEPARKDSKVKCKYKYVHKNMTEQAMNEFKTTASKKMKKILSKRKYKKWMLYGSVLPDFIEQKKTGNKWYTKKIYGEDLSARNLYHGKNREKLNKRKVKVLKKIGKRGKKKNTFILIGAVLHSIEDLEAHSYAMNLQEYKKNIKNDDKYKNNPKNQWQNEYHSDCQYVYDKDIKEKNIKEIRS